MQSLGFNHLYELTTNVGSNLGSHSSSTGLVIRAKQAASAVLLGSPFLLLQAANAALTCSAFLLLQAASVMLTCSTVLMLQPQVLKNLGLGAIAAFWCCLQGSLPLQPHRQLLITLQPLSKCYWLCFEWHFEWSMIGIMDWNQLNQKMDVWNVCFLQGQFCNAIVFRALFDTCTIHLKEMLPKISLSKSLQISIGC